MCQVVREDDDVRTARPKRSVHGNPSIAAAALGIGPRDLVNDVRSFGFFFESLAIRDLRVYMDALHGNMERYHDKTGLECDDCHYDDNGWVELGAGIIVTAALAGLAI